MALCNTVHYRYGNYRKDQVRHYKLWRKKTCWTIKRFTIKAYEVQRHIQYTNIPLHTNKKRYNSMVGQQPQKPDILMSMDKNNS